MGPIRQYRYAQPLRKHGYTFAGVQSRRAGRLVPALVCGAIAIAAIFVWMWKRDPGPREPVDIGGGLIVSVNMTGPSSHSWWATIALIR